MSYRKLEIWTLAQKLVVDLYQFSNSSIPKYHQFEIGSQIRRSVVSVKSNIVEGYGRREFKKEFLKFLIYAQASLDETTDHLLTIQAVYQCDSEQIKSLLKQSDTLGRKLNLFIQSVHRNHR